MFKADRRCVDEASIVNMLVYRFLYTFFNPKGLFSRITFREPLFVGGPGNTSGLERLPVGSGFRGCVRHLEANEHHYRFPLAPQGDAANGFDVGQ